MRHTLRASVAALAIGSTLLTPSTAHAGGGETLEEGACSGAATWKLKVNEAADGRLEMEYEVDVNRRGQEWRVVIFHNRAAVLRRTFTTTGISGSFEARVLRADAAGDDAFRGRAVRVRDGQTCVGRVVVQD